MAFRQSIPAPRQAHIPPPPREVPVARPHSCDENKLADSEEWILFSPRQAAPTIAAAQTDRTNATTELPRLSDFGSLGTKSGDALQTNIDNELTEDGDLDSLDEGLQAFREPSVLGPTLSRNPGTVLPTHDGLGTFPVTSTPARDQLWQHENYNPKRKLEDDQERRFHGQRRRGTVEELESQISEDKRFRIEQWRIEQSQALLGEIEKVTRTDRHDIAARQGSKDTQLRVGGDVQGVQARRFQPRATVGDQNEECEPLWKRIARKFIQDVIGIDEPLLSVILGETLPEDICAVAQLANTPQECQSLVQHFPDQDTWPDRLLHRIARELGLLVHKVSPHRAEVKLHSAISTLDYAGIPVTYNSSKSLNPSQRSDEHLASNTTSLFSPTMGEIRRNTSWGLDDNISCQQILGSETEGSDTERARKEQEYWERELDIKVVFRFLSSRFYSNTVPRRHDTSHEPTKRRDDSIRRADVIRRHHPLVSRARQPSVARLRKEPSLSAGKRPASSCASESVKAGFRHRLARSRGSSHDYWDIGNSATSGSVLASDGMMGVWGKV